jgi:hypothetical protein
MDKPSQNKSLDSIAGVRKTIDDYRKSLTESFPNTDSRIPLLQLLRCVDFNSVLNLTREDSKDQSFVNLLEAWGFNEALSLFWTDDTRKVGIPAFCSTPALKAWGNSVLQACGQLRFIEHYLELLKFDLLEILNISESYLEVRPKHPGSGVEKFEAQELIAWHQAANGFELSQDFFDSHREILEEMRSLVRPGQEHFIAYDTTPAIDDWYDRWAFSIAPRFLGWDCFSGPAEFGGLPFSQYLECVRNLMAFSRKHLDFCSLLCKSHPSIDSMDIFAYPAIWADATRYMSYALNCSEEVSAQLMSSTAVTPDNVSYILPAHASAPAPHYMISKDLVVRSVKGCLDQPFAFLLRELRRNYSKDWDKAVDHREHLFRHDLVDAFSVYDRLIFFTDNISITTSIGKTDIDAFAYDPMTGVAALFQLKWQDLFANSMKERESRKSNFLDKGNEWVNKVCAWLKEGKLAQTLRSCGMPKRAAEGITDTKVFVLGRNFSHFSGEFQKDTRAAWGSWARLATLLQENPQNECPLSFLFDSFQNEPPSSRFSFKDQPVELKIDGLTVVLRPT